MQKRMRRDKLRKMLQEKKKKLLADLHQEIFDRLGHEYSAEFERAMDAGDESFIDMLQSIDIKIVDIRREELARMNEAQRKLEEGTYGICEECGNEIGEERLAAMLYAVRCVECEERLENSDIHGRGPTL